MTHTPTPWEMDEQADGHFSIWQKQEPTASRADGILVATVYDHGDDTVDFLLRAVNAHDDLVAALEALEQARIYLAGAPLASDSTIWEQARAALAKAKAD